MDCNPAECRASLNIRRIRMILEKHQTSNASELIAKTHLYLPKDLDYSAYVVEITAASAGLDEKDGNEVREDGQNVNDIHSVLEELALSRGTCRYDMIVYIFTGVDKN